MQAMEPKQKDFSVWNSALAWAWVAFGALGRLIPHLPNFTPTTSVCLFSGAHLSRPRALASVFAAMIISDVLLAQVHGMGTFGWWSFFTYSGFAAIVLLGAWLGRNLSPERAVASSLAATTTFWLWTNFGTWLVSGMYERTFSGLAKCYALAIPFLGWALVGDLIWMFVLFLSFRAASQSIIQSKSTVPVSK